MSSFLIIGDSWGLGEWGWKGSKIASNHQVTHKGLEQYLLDAGHTVVNKSIPGGSNLTSYDSLENELSKGQVFDYIIWFHTDPLRDADKQIERLTTLNEMLDCLEYLAKESYAKFDSLGAKIHCLGGIGLIDTNWLEPFSNLECVIPSIPQFCVPSFRQDIISLNGWIYLNLRNFTEMDELLKIKNNYDLWKTDADCMKYFYPDGLHANRLAHQLVFQELIKVLDIKI